MKTETKIQLIQRSIDTIQALIDYAVEHDTKQTMLKVYVDMFNNNTALINKLKDSDALSLMEEAMVSGICEAELKMLLAEAGTTERASA